MSPTWARKGSKRWRYYVSQAALQGEKSKAGSILRVPAADVETLVTEALSKLSPGRAASQTDIRELIDRVVIGRATIRIQLSEVAEENDSARILTLPWTRPSHHRKREIIQGANDTKTYARPMPANARAILIEALRDAHRWLDVLLSDPRHTLESIASREGKTTRSIRMTLSLAFLAPEIVKAGSTRTSAARLWSQASRRPADGLAGSVAQARTPGASAGVTNDPLLTRLSSGDELIVGPGPPSPAAMTKAGQGDASRPTGYASPHRHRPGGHRRTPARRGFCSSVSSTCRWPGRISGARSSSRRPPPLLVWLPARGDPSIRTGSSVEVQSLHRGLNLKGSWKSCAVDT